ncbi:hypothetical protein SAMN05414137_119116 [Streptacidiphilus jiangxiensis]|uniref:HEAT repeat-containing protein n=2 Tax=Streptacidiphilus jiangxiensis TaxID=235985 RepID=A0A1H7W0V1_STRJI|nr:hypothetical protein SAMN05414137_119116 [Streptacidiphilus jiangxiensis]
MSEPWDVVSWSGCVHAHGSAENIPAHIAAWRDGGPRQRLDSGDYLREANFAFGIWPATAPTATALAVLLESGGLDEEQAQLPLLFIDRIAHLCDLGSEAEALRERCGQHAGDIAAWVTAYGAGDQDVRESMRSDESEALRLVHESSRLACFDVIPRLVTAVLPHLDDERIRRRGWLAATLAALARHPLVEVHRPLLSERVEKMAQAQTDPHELATALLALGDLGGTPRAWLEHPHIGVRWSAALATSLAADGVAKRLREELVRSPSAYFASFGPGMAAPGQFMAPPYGRGFGEMLLERARACSTP